MSESTQPPDGQSDLELLLELNRNYVRSVDQADAQWFDEHLADDFMNTNPDGTLIDRNRFLTQIARGSTVKDIREFDVLVRVLGTFAIIHAKTRYLRTDGTAGQGCYTDDWQFRGDRWLCVSAHVSRL